MRINELIVEQQLDELSLAGALGSAAKGAANVVGGTRGALAGARDVFNQRADRVANVAQRRVQQAAGYKAPQSTAPATTATPPAATGTQPVTQPASTAATPAPTGTAPAATTPPATGTPASTTQSNPTASGNLGVPAGRQAVDDAVATIKAVRSDRRPQVVAYGIQQLGTVKESNVGIKSNFLGIEI